MSPADLHSSFTREVLADDSAAPSQQRPCGRSVASGTQASLQPWDRCHQGQLAQARLPRLQRPEGEGSRRSTFRLGFKAGLGVTLHQPLLIQINRASLIDSRSLSAHSAAATHGATRHVSPLLLL